MMYIILGAGASLPFDNGYTSAYIGNDIEPCRCAQEAVSSYLLGCIARVVRIIERALRKTV